ncbi:MAG: alpha/beta hydrolase [Hyphomonadaceae bacterium]|nr:alpha/beta hydrolase [Hyphomonadaceae bacterium]
MVGKLGPGAFAGLLLLAACTPLGLNTASTDITHREETSPAVLAAFKGDPAVTTAEEWTVRRAPLLKKAFEDEVYGPVPVELDGVEIGRRVVDANYAGGAGTLEEINVRIGPGPDGPSFRIALALPKGVAPGAKVPLLINENFCGNAGTMGSEALSDGGCMDEGFEASVIRLIFGKYIIKGPNADILKRGYAYATLFAGPFAADDAAVSKTQLEVLAKLLPADRGPNGVVAVWAAAFSWSLDVLEADSRIDASRTAVWGHSRQGKAALLAAAFDPRIEAVIPLQPGKGGAALTRSYAGESVKQITKAYPHWFSPAYAAYADRELDIPVDQHQLLALVAPRPMMLGNGWKDVWSDPNGTFRAAVAADPVYKLLGAKGLTQTGLKDKPNGGELEFFIRSGGHGVRIADWDEMLDFLDRWFEKSSAAAEPKLSH